MSKINGQIWINKNDPYNLMYRAGGKDRVVQTVSKYTLASATAAVVGNMVSLDSTGTVHASTFPADRNNVLGIIISKEDSDIVTANTGSVYIPKSLINSPSNSKGRILYWDISNTKQFTQSLPNSGITYDNFPVVGYITKFSGKTNDEYTVELNMGPFDGTLEFSTTIAGHLSGDIEIEHKLNLGNNGRTKLHIVSIDEYGRSEETSCDHTDASNKVTVPFRTESALTLKISGEAIYSF